MPRPEDVRPAKFPDPVVVYDDGDYAIAVGHWAGIGLCLGRRWNGDGDDPGYPKLFGNPTWLVEPDVLMRPTLCSLLATNLPGVRPEAILQVLGQLQG